MSWFPSIFQQLTWKFLNTEKEGLFPFNPKFQKFWLVHQMEQTLLVWSDWNIRDPLWRWSSLTGLVISVSWTEKSLSFWRNCCPSTALLFPAYKNNNCMNTQKNEMKFLYANILDKKCFLRTLEIVFQGIRRMPPTSFPLAAHPFSTCVINNYSSVGKNILILDIQKVEQSVSQAPQQKCYWACPLFLQTRDIYQ